MISITKLSSAQTPFIYSSIAPTSNQSPCNLLQSIDIYNNFCNFPIGSAITGTVDWGDGNTDPIPTYLTTLGPFSCDSIVQTMTHVYLTSGLYAISVSQNGPGAPVANANYSVNPGGTCMDYSGYVYTDANSNCTYDIGEAVSPNIFIMISTPNSTYYSYTDANGYYHFIGGIFTPGTNTITLSNPNGIVCPVAQTYTLTTATGSNLDFGYTSSPSLGSINNMWGYAGGNCNNNFSFYGYLNVCNLPNGTPITYNINFGDGNTNTTTVNYVYNNNSCDSVSLNSIIGSHSYATAGTYTVTVTATALGTLTSTGSCVVNSQNCINLSGYLFIDANNNCVFDATEQPNAYMQATLQTSLGNYVSTSDQNGYYEFNVPSGIGNYTVIPAVSVGMALSCPAQSPFVSNIPTQTNVNFGYVSPAPSISGTLSDSTLCNSLVYGGNLYFTSCGLPANTTYTINIDFGDGNAAPATVTSLTIGGGCNANYGNVTHTYAAMGTYYLTATIIGGGITTVLYDTAYITNCGTASGYTYVDANNNCVFDPGEQLPYQYVSVTLNNNMIATGYSDASGYYNVQYPFISGNTYVVECNPSSNINTCYNVVCPVALNYLVTTLNANNLDFGLAPNNTNYDNAVTGILAWCCGVLQAGANRTFKVNFQNYLCGANNGTITLTMPANFTYVSSSVTPASIAGNVITWNYTNLSSLSWNNDISLVAYVPFVNAANVPYVNGDPVCLSASIASTSPGTDQNLSNNTYSTCFYIGTSYDPNDKHSLPKGTGPQGNIEVGTELEYVIRFQNTGTFPAQQVYILDTLDSDLDISTLQVLASSHHMVFTQNGNALKFDFPNIMLPDSNSDAEGSMGFVRFKVKHNANAPLGTVINNTANIYFDFNAPVVTNTTINTLALLAAVNDVHGENQLSIYPNPANEWINIETSGTATISHVIVYNALGKKVKELHSDKNKINVSIKDLSVGVYFMQITDKNGTNYSNHFIKE